MHKSVHEHAQRDKNTNNVETLRFEQIPETLAEFPSITSEKVLKPVSYISPSEEEMRLLSSSVNSLAVLRMMGAGGAGAGGGGRGAAPPLRGRGASVGPERGRGRGEFRG